MRMLVFVLGLAGLVGCNTPGPAFQGAPVSQVALGGSVFDVRVKGNRAQAIRVNRQYAPRVGPIGVRAGLAIELVSGCKVRRLDGDQAVLVARLSCGRATAPAVPEQLQYECEVDDSYLSRGQQLEVTDMTCRLVPV
ncbi:hypothetical protein [Thalassovita taeanensis]|uniref:Lipoprotein n=1 Tax=Thalassovita taeanensis TaxID=657014 RepID=A0A1H9DH46_9RHOB|nr:hypothetical protein [Thalassovita taeanensis]SEQ12825.1 hypothetical protein SAMN04488092_104154 [Thalassovita taeanensis]